MIDIVQILDQIGQKNSKIRLKLAASQLDLIDKNLENELPQPVKEKDRYGLFRQHFESKVPTDIWEHYFFLIKKHLYKIWLDNRNDKTSEELYLELSNLNNEQLQNEWEDALKKYKYDVQDLPDTRQLSLPISEPEVIVAPSPRELKERQHFYTDGNKESIKSYIRELESFTGLRIVETCMRYKRPVWINNEIHSWWRKFSKADINLPQRQLIDKISASFPNFSWWLPSESIQHIFAEITLSDTVPKEMYQDWIKHIREIIIRCTHLKSEIYQFLEIGNGELYPAPKSIEGVNSIAELEDWYSKYILFFLEKKIRKNIVTNIFGNRKIGNKTFNAFSSVFSSGEMEEWFENPEELSKWISGVDTDTVSHFGTLGGMSIEIWLHHKYAKLKDYEDSLIARLKMLKADFQWLKSISKESLVSTGTKDLVDRLNNYIDIVKSQILVSDIEQMIDRLISGQKTVLLYKIKEKYKNLIGNAVSDINKTVFFAAIEEFSTSIEDEFRSWRTGLSSDLEELTPESIYKAAEIAADNSKIDLSTAWKFPKFSPWPKQYHSDLAEIAKRRVGIDNILKAHNSKKIKDTLYNFLDKNPSHKMFEGRSKSEVIESMQKHKQFIFQTCNDRQNNESGYKLSRTYFDFNPADKVMESAKYAYPKIYSFAPSITNNIYNETFQLKGSDLKLFPDGIITFHGLVTSEDIKEKIFRTRDGTRFSTKDIELEKEFEKLRLELIYTSFASFILSLNLNMLDSKDETRGTEVGIKGLLKYVEKVINFQNIGFSEETIKAIKNVAISHAKDDFKALPIAKDEGDYILRMPISVTNSFPHNLKYLNTFLAKFATNNCFLCRLIKHYNVSNESLIEGLASNENISKVAFPPEEVERALKLFFPKEIKELNNQLDKIIKFMNWVHSNGAQLDDKTLIAIWKNPNTKSAISGENETTATFLELYAKLKRYGGYNGIAEKYKDTLDLFIKNGNIRKGFKTRVIKFAKLVRDNVRLHPDIPEYEEAKANIIELSSDMYILEASEAYKTFSSKAEIKNKKLFILNFQPTTESRWRFRVLKDLDPYHFKVGADTNCCQSLGQVGASAAIDSYINPLAGVLVLELKTDIGWKTAAQSYFHFVPSDNGYILDNVEINRKISNLFESIFGDSIDLAYEELGKYLKEKGVSYFRCGLKYNKLDGSRWKITRAKGADPRSFAVKNPYSDYSHSQAIDLFQPK